MRSYNVVRLSVTAVVVYINVISSRIFVGSADHCPLRKGRLLHDPAAMRFLPCRGAFWKCPTGQRLKNCRHLENPRSSFQDQSVVQLGQHQSLFSLSDLASSFLTSSETFLPSSLTAVAAFFAPSRYFSTFSHT